MHVYMHVYMYTSIHVYCIIKTLRKVLCFATFGRGSSLTSLLADIGNASTCQTEKRKIRQLKVTKLLSLLTPIQRQLITVDLFKIIFP
jgi:hypothetical protein